MVPSASPSLSILAGAALLYVSQIVKAVGRWPTSSTTQTVADETGGARRKMHKSINVAVINGRPN